MNQSLNNAGTNHVNGSDALLTSARAVIADLRELAALTATTAGAQRLAWGPVWRTTRAWFEKKALEAGATLHRDAAGNLWARLQGESDDSVVIGSHLDSVPNGGWLDGCLGVLAGLEILRRYRGQRPPLTLYAVDWADEEGARFGRSLLGSAAAGNNLNIEEVRHRVDNQGVRLVDALRENGIELDRMLEAHGELLSRRVQAYLELHIEQGPVLEAQGKQVACVYGITGVERHFITFTGQAAHAGSFPIPMRRDGFLAAAQASLAFRQIALKYNGVCTVGKVQVKPDVVTIVPRECTISLDQRHIDKAVLREMHEAAREAVAQAAKDNDVNVSWEKIWTIDPTVFDARLIELCSAAVEEVTGEPTRMFSGPLHDAAEAARWFPSVMMFTLSERGLSHTREENTPDEALEAALSAFFLLTEKVLTEPRPAPALE